MKTTKTLLSIFLAVLLMFSITSVAYATEETGNCEVTISLVDQSRKYPGETIKVIFEDESGVISETIKLKKEESWGVGQVVTFSLPAPAEYSITFVDVLDGFEINDTLTNSAPRSSFEAKKGKRSFTWAFVTDPEAVLPVGVGEELENATKESAEEVYKEFLDAVSFIENDESWYNGFAAPLNQYEPDTANGMLYCQWYVDYVEGGTEEEFFAMTPFERFLWTNTYTRIAYAAVGSKKFDSYFETKAKFDDKIVKSVTFGMKGNNSEVVIEAYEKLMDWQYAYTEKYLEPYNFITNQSYSEGAGEAPAETLGPATLTEDDKEDILEVYEDLVGEETVTEETVPEETEEKGIWTDTGEALADNALTILLLVALSIGLFVIVRIRKSKNVD